MIPAIRVGTVRPSDRGRIEKIVRATGVFSNDEISVALELFDVTSADYEFVGAFDESGDLVGYACYGATPSADRTYDLYWIAVHPSAQRLGAGAALMADIERRLEQRRARLVVVETSSRAEYAPTRQFYAKRGYQQAAQLRDFYARGDDRVILTKHLSVMP